jgi:hypothetical protein
MPDNGSVSRPSAFLIARGGGDIVSGIMINTETLLVLDLPAHLIDVSDAFEVIIRPGGRPAERISSSYIEAHQVEDGPLLGFVRLNRPCASDVPAVRPMSVDDFRQSLEESPADLGEALQNACPDLTPPESTLRAQELLSTEFMETPRTVNVVTHSSTEDVAFDLCLCCLSICKIPDDDVRI